MPKVHIIINIGFKFNTLILLVCLFGGKGVILNLLLISRVKTWFITWGCFPVFAISLILLPEFLETRFDNMDCLNQIFYIKSYGSW